MDNFSHVPNSEVLTISEGLTISREMEGSDWSSDDHRTCPDPKSWLSSTLQILRIDGFPQRKQSYHHEENREWILTRQMEQMWTTVYLPAFPVIL